MYLREHKIKRFFYRPDAELAHNHLPHILLPYHASEVNFSLLHTLMLACVQLLASAFMPLDLKLFLVYYQTWHLGTLLHVATGSSKRMPPMHACLLASTTKAQSLQNAAAAWYRVWPNVLPELCFRVGLGELYKDVMCSGHVFRLASPCFQGGGLQGSAVGECESPGGVGACILECLQQITTWGPTNTEVVLCFDASTLSSADPFPIDQQCTSGTLTSHCQDTRGASR